MKLISENGEQFEEQGFDLEVTDGKTITQQTLPPVLILVAILSGVFTKPDY